MKEIILSADSPCVIYSVPDQVADDLDRYCFEFTKWIRNDPNGAKLLHVFNGMEVAVYDETDFIEYLNRWLFPDQPSVQIMKTEFYPDELPEGYKDYPQYHF